MTINIFTRPPFVFGSYKHYNVPSYAFKSFKGKNDKFDEKLKNDIRGVKELYEASQLSIEGEIILDEAANFSYHVLKEAVAFLEEDAATTIRCTLGHPNQKSLCYRFNLNNIIKDFDGTTMKELAKLDFAIIQSIHQMELNQIFRWWKDIRLGEELNLARDQPLKWYLCSMAALTHQNLSSERLDLTKTISLIYIIDDIFDLYGTLEELSLFTELVNRWDINTIEQLPYYMRTSFKALYDITNEISNRIYERHGFNPINYLRKSWATLCDAFLLETKWFTSGDFPKADEYLENGITSSGVHVVLVHLFFLLGDGTTEERANLIHDNRGIITSVAKILRLWDDLGNAQDENQDGRDGSYIKCFLKEHEGCSVKVSEEHVINMISSEWKCLNKECLAPNPFSKTFTEGSLNIARMVPLMYSYSDVGSLPLLKDYTKKMLYNNV